MFRFLSSKQRLSNASSMARHFGKCERLLPCANAHARFQIYANLPLALLGTCESQQSRRRKLVSMSITSRPIRPPLQRANCKGRPQERACGCSLSAAAVELWDAEFNKDPCKPESPCQLRTMPTTAHLLFPESSRIAAPCK